MKYLIIEDTKNTSEDLFKIIKSYSSDALVDQAFTLQEATQLLNSASYDILVVDIQLPDGTIFDLLDNLKNEDKINFELIFITGTDNKSLIMKAIKFAAVDFLAKPYDKQKFIEILSFAEESVLAKLNNSVSGLDIKQLHLLLENLKSNRNTKRIAVRKIGGIIEFIELKDILYVMADREICTFHFKEKLVLNASKHLGYYKDGLLSEDNFIQVHNNCILNIDFVKSLDPNEKVIKLQNGEHVIASRRRFKDLIEKIGL